MRLPLGLLFSSIAATVGLVGCDPSVGPGTGPADAGAALDVIAAIDVVAPADDGPPTRDSGCPAPQLITPTQIPAGFLAPMTVPFLRSVDGDTAHFSFAILGETTTRFLWVNTEESHAQNPADNTAFGVATAARVAGYMAGSHTFVVAPRNSTRTPGTHDLDPYGRSLVLVFIDGQLFQERLVREGLSAYYTDFGCAPEPVHSALLLAEAEARANLRGIWAPGHPTNYAEVFSRWITGGTRACRPNPFRGQSYCP